MRKTFWTSDLHLNDEYFITHTAHMFKSMVEYHNRLTFNWNRKVSNNDTVYILGDVGNFTETTEFMLQHLHGNKVLVEGNHDLWEAKHYTIFFRVYTFPVVVPINGTLVLASHYPLNSFEEDYDICIHGHIHSYENTSLPTRRDYALNDKLFNCAISLNNWEPVTLEELYHNKPKHTR